MLLIETRDTEEMSLRAAEQIAALLTLKRDAVLGLATGSTPIGAYAKLAQWHKENALSFRQVKTVNLDEYRGLSPQSPDSYRWFMNHHLFQHVDIDMQNTHVPNGLAEDVREECARYDALIESLHGIDLQLLGIGMNGHIGFNEPASTITLETHCVTLSENTREVNAAYFASKDAMPTEAITMGMRPILQARRVLLVAAANKRGIIEKALFGPVTPEVPASLLQLHKRLTVVLARS